MYVAMYVNELTLLHTRTRSSPHAPLSNTKTTPSTPGLATQYQQRRVQEDKEKEGEGN